MAYLDARPLAATCCRIRRITAHRNQAHMAATFCGTLYTWLALPPRFVGCSNAETMGTLCFFGSGTYSRE
jgi:hypothetical protein